MKTLKIFLVYILILVIFLSLVSCSSEMTAEQIANNLFINLRNADYDGAAALFDKTFVGEHTQEQIPIRAYLQAVCDNRGAVEEYDIVSTREYDKAGVLFHEYMMNVSRNGTMITETLLISHENKILSYHVPQPTSDVVGDLYAYETSGNSLGLKQLFSAYLEGYTKDPEMFFSDIQDNYGAHKSFEIVSKEYYYEDYEGALMQACARFDVVDHRGIMDADVVVTVSKGKHGLEISGLDYTPVYAAQIMDSIMQCYFSDDYQTLKSLYSKSYINTIGGEFNIHLNDIVLRLEQEYGDITNYTIDGYRIFDMQTEDEQSMPAIEIEYTVHYEFGTTQELITLAKQQNVMKIYIHYVFVS